MEHLPRLGCFMVPQRTYGHASIWRNTKLERFVGIEAREVCRYSLLWLDVVVKEEGAGGCSSCAPRCDLLGPNICFECHDG